PPADVGGDIGAGLTQPGRAGTGTGIGTMSAGTSGGGTGTNRPAGGGGFGSSGGGVGGAGGGVGTPQPPVQSQPGSVGDTVDTVGSGIEPVLRDSESLFNWVFGDALADLRRMEQELASITVPDAGLVYLRQMQSLIVQIDRMM